MLDNEELTEEEIESLKQFIKELKECQRDIEPEIAEMLDENLWDLI